MTYYNACSLGPQTEAEAKKLNWHRMDCLAANKLKTECNPLKLQKWFASQDKEWQAARKARFSSRLVGR